MTDTTTYIMIAGFAGTGRKVHVAIQGGPGYCSGIRRNTRLWGTSTGTSNEELAAKLAKRGIKSAAVCSSCANGLKATLAGIEAEEASR